MRFDPYTSPISVPSWASVLTVTVSVGPITDDISTWWTIVQSNAGGDWVDVGGLSSNGIGSTSSATTVHACYPGLNFRVVSNFPSPSFIAAVA
jgi:hypothetical protein